MNIVARDGFWYDQDDPSRGGAGVPVEELERREEEYARRSCVFDEVYSEIRNIQTNTGRVKVLEKLGYGRVKVSGKIIPLNEALKTNKGKAHILRMYDNTINVINRLRENPLQNSILAERIIREFS